MGWVPLQQVNPALYKYYMESAVQPGLTAGQTQAATGAEGASAARTTQETQIAQQQLNQQNFLRQTQDTFDKAKGQNGYVDPSLYNAQQQKAAALNIDSQAFDNKFAGPFTDPNNINYNTDAGKATQEVFGETKRQIQALLGRYSSIPEDQKGLISKSSVGGIPLIGDKLQQALAPDAYAYEKSRQGLAANLKSIAGAGSGSGVRITQTELNNWSNLIPDIGDAPDVANKKVQQLDSLIKAKFNTPTGLDVPNSQPPTQGGGSNILQNAASDTKGALNGILNLPRTAIQAGGEINQNVQQNPLLSLLGPGGALLSTPTGQGMVKGVVNEYNQALGQPLQGGDILGRILQHAQQHPINTALDALPFLGAAKSLTGAKAAEDLNLAKGATAAEGADAAMVLPKVPNKLMQVLNPQGTKNAGSALRDAAVGAAQEAGKTITGDNLVAEMEKWRGVAKQANPGAVNASKIDDIANGVIDQYKGKAVNPNDAVNIYHEIDSGFSRNGIQKESIQASADMALRDAFGKQLEKVAPGWQQGTGLIAKGFKTEKSIPGQIAKNLPQNVVKTGLNVAGLGILRDILGL